MPLRAEAGRPLGSMRVAVTAALLALATGIGRTQSAEDLRMTVGKSVVIDYPADIRQISTSNPEIVDASPVTTREILLHGKGLGTATMVVWSKSRPAHLLQRHGGSEPGSAAADPAGFLPQRANRGPTARAIRFR